MCFKRGSATFCGRAPSAIQLSGGGKVCKGLLKVLIQLAGAASPSCAVNETLGQRGRNPMTEGVPGFLEFDRGIHNLPMNY